MTNQTAHNRLDELLADACLGEIDSSDQSEFESLLQRFPGSSVDEFDNPASLLQIALFEDEQLLDPMPSGVIRDAEQALLGAMKSAPDATRTNAELSRSTPGTAATATLGRTPLFGWFGWAAAAACLLLAASFALDRGASNADAPMSTGDRLVAFERSAPADLISVDWTATEDPAAAGTASGRVVWSDSQNEGYMVFDGLAANDPTVEQYQLWIFDAERDEAHPVDGGVFDIAATTDGRAIVEIDPRVPVNKATLFAITVERPGGVVVSSRERLPLLAPVSAG